MASKTPKNKRIVIVDDEQDILTYLSVVLKGHAYLAYPADSAQAGLKLVSEVNPHLICLDIMMPKESGISLYTKIRKDSRFQHVPVLILSGVVREEEYDFRKLVPDESIPPPEAYLEKPIKVEHFLEVIHNLLL